jgi:hypothetical protein
LWPCGAGRVDGSAGGILKFKMANSKIQKTGSLKESKLILRLTPAQKKLLSKAYEDGYFILGQPWVAENPHGGEIGTADFYFMDPEAGELMNRAITRATDGMKARGTLLPLKRR